MLESIKRLFRREPEIDVNVKFAPVTNYDTAFSVLGLPKPKNEDNFADAAANINWVYTANTIRSETAAMLPLKAYSMDSKGKKTEVVDAYTVKLLRRPNAFVSTMELLQTIFGSLGYSGNAYILIDTDYDRLWALHPKDVSVIADKQNFIKGYVYRPLSEAPQFFAANQIIHIKTFNPNSYFYGLGPVQACWSQVTFLDKDEQFWKAFWNEGGRLYGIWTTEGSLDKDAVERIKVQMKQAYGGAKKMAANIVVDKGLKFNQIGVSQKDAQLLEKYKISREEILAAFKVPPSIAGILEFANYSNVEMQERIFYKQAILPLLKLVENTFSNHPVMSANGQIKFEFDISGVESLKSDEREKAITGKILIESGQMTQNEIRTSYWNLPPLADGNVLKPVADIQNPYSVSNNFEDVSFKYLPEDLKDSKEIKELPPVNVPKKPMRSNRTKETRDQIAKSYDDLLKPFDEELGAKIRKIFSEQKDTVLKNLRSKLKNHGQVYFKKGQDDDLTDGLSAYSEAIEAALAGTSKDVIQKFGKLTKDEIQKLLPNGDDRSPIWNFDDPRIARFIRNRSVHFGKTINEETMQMVRDEIAFLFGESGADLRTVSEGINAFFDGMAGWRSMRIARTETGAGAQEAINTTYELNRDIVSGKEWITARDERVRDSHQIDGQTVAIDESFILNDGNEADGPYDPSLPPEDVINCRCTTVPVIDLGESA